MIRRILVLLSFIGLGFSFAPSMGRFYHSKVAMQMTKTDINMPALSSTMKEGKIVSWNKKVGDKVRSGDVLLVVESDKADMDVESFHEGYLAAIYTPEGGTAAVGAAVATLVDNIADVGKVGSTSQAAAPVATQSSSAAVPAAASGPVPKFTTVTMPALSSTMKEGKIVNWSKKVGDKISSGDVMLVVESDKADMDVESYTDGYLAAIMVGDGQVAAVSATLAYIAATKDEVAAVADYAKNGGTAAPAPAAPVVAAASNAAAPVSSSSPAASSSPPAIVNTGHVSASGYAKSLAEQRGIDLRTVTPSRADHFITAQDLEGAVHSSGSASGSAHVPAPGVINATPMARKLAAENNLEVGKIAGTGNFGRVTQEDVLRAAGKLPAAAPPKSSAAAAPPLSASAVATPPSATSAAPAAAVQDSLVAMDGMQKAVAKNMEKTLSVPVFRVSREIVTDEFDALYAVLKPKGVSVSAMLAKAVSMVLAKHPLLNAAYSTEGGGSIKFNKDVNVAMAVAIDGGLITPTIVGTQDMDIYSIGRKWKELVDKAKGKKLTPAEYSSGTFTISNLGMFGVSEFGAILPPGTGSILAISSSLPKVVQQKNGHFGVQKVMKVTITCDHRHIYGADAATFLQDLADLLENNVNSLTMG